MKTSYTPVIYIVDDDKDLCGETGRYLAANGFIAKSFHDIDELEAGLLEQDCDIILLDIMLPGRDGLSFLKDRRDNGCKVLITSSLGGEIDKVLGLELGAEDYIVKPFSLRELLARIKIILRRPDLADSPRPCANYRFSGWTLETRTRLLIDQQGVVKALGIMEFRLLRLLLEHPRQVLDRDSLLNAISENPDEALDSSLDVLVSRLRLKLGESAREQNIIRTVWKRGYLLAVDVEREHAG